MKLYDVSVCLGKSDSRWMEVFRFKGVAWKGVVEGGGGWLYGVCSDCLTGSLSCQQWWGITCSPVSERQFGPFKYTFKL